MCCNALRAEFSREKIFFQPIDDEKDLSRQCCEGAFMTGGAHLITKGLLCTAMLATVVVSVTESVENGDGDFYMIYLTNWGALLLTLSHVLGFFVALFRRALESPCVSWFTTAATFIRSLANPIAFLITIAYWTLIYKGQAISAANFMTHGLNSVIVLCDILLSTYTSRLSHLIWGVLFSAIYVSWSGIHYAANIGNKDGHRYIYDSLSWAQNKVVKSIAYVSVIMIIVLPSCYLMCFGLTKLRDYCARRRSFNDLDIKE